MSEAGQHHQHGHGGQAMHSPGSGGDGQSLGQLLGLGGDGGAPQHNFLSHLLGLDHDAHVHGGGHGDMGGAPSQSAGWNSALQSVKLSDALEGIRVTPNMLFICMFCCFIAWLGVIYWVRHHEPLANSVLGTAAAHCATSAADRQILAGTKYAFPTRTCEEMGDIYVPSPAPALAGSAEAHPDHSRLAFSAVPLPAPPAPAPPFPEPKPVPLAGNTAFSQPGSYMPVFSQQRVQSNAFFVPEPESAGTRLKMIVNR
ncbi:MAG TPA: hypothetical protein V6D22_03230 [Candidatus Obscuribacterales bacterium]